MFPQWSFIVDEKKENPAFYLRKLHALTELTLHGFIIRMMERCKCAQKEPFSARLRIHHMQHIA